VIAFLTKKWQKENGYRLRKELFTFRDHKIAVHVCFTIMVLVTFLSDADRVGA
jgi:nuclear transport factor 2 (NTF2) superfamily protein